MNGIRGHGFQKITHNRKGEVNLMVKNTFKQEGRWDTVGLDCGCCQFFKSPSKWPDQNHEIYCNFHKVPLTIELRENNYLEGEWFCKNFKDNGKALKNAFKHFEETKSSLADGILYRFEKINEDLKEININQLKL